MMHRVSQSSDNVQTTNLAPDEHYNGLSKTARRQLQNRLNKRNSRQKKRQLSQGTRPNLSNRKWVIYTDKRTSEKETRISALRHVQNAQRVSQTLYSRKQAESKTTNGSRFCQLELVEREAFLARLRHQVTSGAARHLLRCDLLLSVTQHNIVVAMGANAISIGLTMDSLHQDILSPFNTLEPWGGRFPPSLWPTILQKQIPHHPWIDLFPMASVRDVLLKRVGEYDEDELCHDIFGTCVGQQGQAGMLIWGEAWDPLAYEISESVAQKWLWMFHECIDIIRSSNHWRAKRGEKPLSVQKMY